MFRVQPRPLRWIAGAVALASTFGCGDLPPRGEAVIVVDTDLPSPTLISALRVDVYESDGSWFESRDLRLLDPRDWPASFSIVAPGESSKDVLVRLRGYPEGQVRRYVGERFREHEDFVPPYVPHSMDEACANAPLLELGKMVTVRRSHRPFASSWSGECAAQPITTGTAVVRVEIPEPGSYTFGVVALQPEVSGTLGSAKPAHALLALWSSCTAPNSSVACSTGLDAKNNRVRPEIVVNVSSAGTYFLATAGWFEFQSADVTFAAARTADWPLASPTLPLEADANAVPRYLDDDPSRTPKEEPEPASSIDRLVATRLEYGQVRQVNVVLRADCSGTMADLADGVGSAQSCVDQERVLEPVSFVSGSQPSAPAPIAKDFGVGEACPPETPSSEVVCVPGGPSLLGYPEATGSGAGSSTPERLTVLDRFFIDRYEVTVARYRAALKSGFVPEKVVAEAVPFGPDHPLCTWTPEPADGEDHPLNCISWPGARAFCQFVGGDLPTEAQWEYVAQSAGRDRETLFPWGSAPPCCGTTNDASCAKTAQQLKACSELPVKTTPVDAFGDPGGDVSLGLGVVGLAGNVRELVRDAFYGYDHACWRATRIRDRVCRDPEALDRTTRGGDFTNNVKTAVARRKNSVGAPANFTLGFRCAYATARETPP